MKDNFEIALRENAKLAIADELRGLNAVTVRYSLSLSEQQIANIVQRRVEALDATGRIEFGRGITKKLVEAFCDSPYIDQENYEETILDLLDSFYYFKNESEDRIPDDELIAIMRGEIRHRLRRLHGLPGRHDPGGPLPQHPLRLRHRRRRPDVLEFGWSETSARRLAQSHRILAGASL